MFEVHAGFRDEKEVHRGKPAADVKHFNEQRERPTRRMLTLDEERRILDAAPPYRVAIILLSQTGGRTYSEGFSLRWSQVDFDQKVIRLDNNVKTPTPRSRSPSLNMPLTFYRHGSGNRLRSRASMFFRARSCQAGPCQR